MPKASLGMLSWIIWAAQPRWVALVSSAEPQALF